MTVSTTDFREIAAKKVQQRDAKFNSKWLVPEEKLPPATQLDVLEFIPNSGFLTEEELVITEATPSTILENIASKKWRSVQVLSAFAHRATVAHQLVNCLTEVFIEEGLKQAQELEDTKTPLGI